MQIWKFRLMSLYGRQSVKIPKGACCIHTGYDPFGFLCIWCEVEPSAERVHYVFETIGTGQNTPSEDGMCHLHTYLVNQEVLHVYSSIQQKHA